MTADSTPSTGEISDAPPPDDAAEGRLVRLVLVALIAGLLTGAVGGAFRVALTWAGHNGVRLLEWAREDLTIRWIAPVVLISVSVALARLVVRFVPETAGSGVQRVEAVYRSEVTPVGLSVLPAKFVGGMLSLGAGMALGREGPTVQMGASLGDASARWGRVDAHDRRLVTTAAAGAGLGVAFNAPLGGAIFVFEEVAHAFRTRLVLATLITVVAAIAVSRAIVGANPIFKVTTTNSGSVLALVAYVGLGLILGVMGVAYNRVVIVMLDLVARLRRIPPEVQAGAVGLVVAGIGLAAPFLIGGGEALNQTVLDGSVAVGTLGIILVVRFLLGPLCYSVSTPGGLFAPLLLVGAVVGALFAHGVNAIIPGLGLTVVGAAVVGMSSFFTAVVRAPLTGIVLIVEMTATTSVLLPMILAAGAAEFVATILRGEPVYDTLRARLPRVSRPS